MKTKLQWKSMTAIGLATACLLLILWAGFMYAGTREMAYHYFDMIELKSDDFVEEIYNWGMKQHYDSVEEMFLWEEKFPGLLEYNMLDTIRWANQTQIEEQHGLEQYKTYPVQTAVMFFNQEGKLLHSSGDYLYFQYSLEEDWSISGDRYGWINLGKLDSAMLDKLKESNFYTAMKITGEMNENEMCPVRIETKNAHEEEWRLVFAEPDLQQENSITIYAGRVDVTYYNAGRKVSFQDKEYDNLMALLEYRYQENNLWNAENDIFSYVSFGSRTLKCLPEEVLWTTGRQEIQMVTAYMASPLKIAVEKMMPYYLISLLFLLIIWHIMNQFLRLKLLRPLNEINRGICEGYTNLHKKEQKSCHWKEIEELRDNYEATKYTLHVKENEINRLKTALSYAEKAEKNRRQMTSNIAHELKTPLAIIHSYTEGLKEHIAEEKKEEYYDIIFSEVARMDGMVMEMLDLSRLEAGRVKLSMDEFSLKMMTETIFEAMANLIREKKLNVSMDLCEDSIVLADEGRIYQVILNFVSNAVRYTPEGGDIKVELCKGRGRIRFTIENRSNPFSDEELSKIWETFYRTDQSRNSEGTGLGLAIAKNIVELHGGRCSVRNTKNGVKFGFELNDNTGL